MKNDLLTRESRPGKFGHRADTKESFPKIRCSRCNKTNQLTFNPQETRYVQMSYGTQYRRTIYVGYSKLLSTLCEHCGEPVTTKDLDDKADTIPGQYRGYALLIKAVIQHSVQYNGDNEFQRMMRRRLNRQFATRSVLINHFCDIFDYDPAKVRQGILIHNFM